MTLSKRGNPCHVVQPGAQQSLYWKTRGPKFEGTVLSGVVTWTLTGWSEFSSKGVSDVKVSVTPGGHRTIKSVRVVCLFGTKEAAMPT